MSDEQAARRGLFSDALIRSYVDEDPRFAPRRWLADVIDEKLADPGCRFVLLTGEPGSGKSALMAWLARSHPDWPRYFIRRDSQVPLNSGDARSLLFALGHQLAALRPALFQPERLELVVRQRIGQVTAGGQAVGLRVEDLVVSPFRETAVRIEQDAGVVAGVLTGISAARLVADERLLELANLQYLALLDPAALLLRDEPSIRLVVLVDALDELRYHSEGDSALDWLAACPELPANLRLVLTSRPDESLLALFRKRQGRWLREASIDEDSTALTADLTRYATSFAREPAVQAVLEEEAIEREAFTVAAVAHADGNFQYLAALVRGVEERLAALARAGSGEGGEQRAELRRLLRLEEVPAGLGALYGFFLSLIRDAVAGESVEVPAAEPGARERLPAWEGLYQPMLGVLAVAYEPLTAAQIARLGAIEAEERWLRGALARLTQFLDHDDGRYRLYHATFPEYLTAAATRESHPDDYLEPSEWHRTITGQAVSACGKDWLGCQDHYIRAHLAGHAAAVGLLDGLLTDALFLLAAEPVGLLRSLSRASDSDARQAAAVYDRIVRHIAGTSAGEAASYLELAARQAGLDWLADRAGGADVGQRWRARWARWQPLGRSRIIGRHAGPVGAVAASELDGRRLVISGGGDGSVRRWDLASRAELGAPLRGHGDLVRTLAVTQLDGRPVALSGGRNGAVCLWDLRSSEALWASHGHTGLINSVAVTAVDGRPMAVSGGVDATVRLWDLVTGEPLGEPLCTDSRVLAVATAELNGRPVVVCAGADGSVRRWELHGGQSRAALVRTHDGGVRGVAAVAVMELDGRLVALSSGGSSGAIERWDVASGEALGEPLVGHEPGVSAIGGGEFDGLPVAISGGRDGTVRLWDVRAGRAIRAPLRGHEDTVYGVALSELDGRAIALSGGYDGTVRVWDLGAGEAHRQPSRSQPGWVTALAVGQWDGRWVALSGSRDGTVQLWDVASGELLVARLGHHDSRVTAVAVATCDGRPIGVSAGRDGTVLRWDLATGELLGEPLPTGGVSALVVTELDGRQLMVAAGGDGMVVRWDAASGEALGQPRRRYASALRALAVTELDGRPVAVSGGDSGALRVWDVASGEPLGKPLRGHTGPVSCVAITELDDRPIAISGGQKDGKLRLWDLATGTALGKRMHTEKRWRVCGLAAAEVDGRAVAFSGGGWDQGTMRLWDLNARSEELQVELGAKITAIAFTPSGLVVSTHAGLLGITPVPKRRQRESIDAHVVD